MATAPKRSWDQLRNQTWATREAAVKELRRNGHKESASNDWAIGETSPGSTIWCLIVRTDDVSQEPPADEPQNEVVGKKKPAISRIKAAKQGPKPGRETVGRKKKSRSDDTPDQVSDEPAIEVPAPSEPATKPKKVEAKGRIGVRSPDSKRGRCAALLLREGGATSDELREVLGRKGSPLFIGKLARMNGGAVEQMSENRWRIVKKS